MYEGDDLVAEFDGAGVVSNRYVHGSSADEALVWYEGQGVSSTTRRYVYGDHQGSTVALANASGAKLGIYKYDAYGNPSGTNGTFRFQYTGQAVLPSIGLSYYKARFYNATLGRFMQTDPTGLQDDSNLYAYVGNDPFNRTDPAGTDARIVVWDDGKVDIALPIYFKGSAANGSNIATVVNSIQSRWTGRFGAYDVTTKVELLSQQDLATAPVTNEIELINGPTNSNKGHSYVRGGAEGMWTMDDVAGTPIPDPAAPNQLGVATKGSDTLEFPGFSGHVS